MKYANIHNDQFIINKIGNKSRCQKGGMYGISESNMMDNVKMGLGKFRTPLSKHSNCGEIRNQSGGNLQSYGFTGKGASLASEMRGTYPVYSVKKQPRCGGGRKRKSRRKKKSKKRRSKKRRSYRKKKSKKRRSKKRRSRGKKKSRRRRKTRGGGYKQYQSNVAMSSGYSTPNPSSVLPWATGPGSFAKTGSGCRDTYNHLNR